MGVIASLLFLWIFVLSEFGYEKTSALASRAHIPTLYAWNLDKRNELFDYIGPYLPDVTYSEPKAQVEINFAEDEESAKTELRELLIPNYLSLEEITASPSFNLSTPDGTYTDLVTRKYSGITHEQYTVKEGFTISSVSDKNVKLWKLYEGSGEKCTAINLYSRGSHKLFLAIWILNGRHLNIKRFENVNGKWNNIGLKEFNEKLNRVKQKDSDLSDLESDDGYSVISFDSMSQCSSLLSDELEGEGFSFISQAVLDISSPNKHVINIEKGVKNGVIRSKYSRKFFKEVISVSDSGDRFWDMENGDSFKYGYLYTKDGYPPLFLLYFKNLHHKTKYFSKSKGKWTQISYSDFYKYLEIMEFDLHPEDPELVNLTAINIFVRNDNLYRTFYHYYDGNNVKLIIPGEYSSVKRVFEGRTKVCELPSKELLEYTKIYLNKHDEPKLILVTSSVRNIFYHRYYVKNGKKWDHCKDYLKQLNSLKIIADKPAEMVLYADNIHNTYNCTIFETITFGINTRHFFPNLGYYATEVVHSGTPIFKMGKDEHFIYCSMYNARNRCLFTVYFKRKKDYKIKCFERINGQWETIALEMFKEIIRESVKASDSYYSLDQKIGVAKFCRYPRSYVALLQNTTPGETGHENPKSEFSTAQNLLFSPQHQQMELVGEKQPDANTLDLSRPYTNAKFIVCYFALCPSYLYFIDQNTTITRIVIGDKELCRSKSGEQFVQCLLILKDNIPRAALTISRSFLGDSGSYYVLEQNKWKHVTRKVGKKIDMLRVVDLNMARLDISSQEDLSEKCTVTSMELEGVPTILYIPKITFAIMAIFDGENELWKTDVSPCFLLKFVSGKSFKLLEASAYVDAEVFSFYCEFVEGTWAIIGSDQYNQKMKEIKAEFVKGTESV
ncbi:hypothetical protein BEWA_016580 [Theileria equi strain WA]|uniref:Signal peptide-containing protein n=1 Tax=Theileria equi strain WA TaxID=1537102 RepID=L1L9X4_THEEQ|nr:hypothetical protein BEWA_016580 [Theileria equi strain WA]EKX71980.1 hypothetical protein BEWA_016580 [Theileria equi strain WA]|eukprot:XP_004831432.1 hypothetical protein BEWA_016580 [Theileria equi strain WA]